MVMVLFGLNEIAKKYISNNINERIVIVDNMKNGMHELISGKEYIIESPTVLSSINDKHILVMVRSKDGKKEIDYQLKNMGYQYLTDYSFLEDGLIDVGTICWETKLDNEIEFINKKYFPKTLHLGLTDICNLKCKFCGFHGEKVLWNDLGHFMTTEIADEIANQASSIPTFKQLYFTHDGEDFLHKDWDLIANRILCTNTNIEEFSIYTNGMLLNEKNIEKLKGIKVAKIKLVISIDGNTSEENDYYRCGSKYSTIYQNIHNALDALEDKNVSFFINNNHIIDEKILKENNYVFKPYNQPVPEYLLSDFKETKINILSGPTLYLQPKEAGYPQINNCKYVYARKNNTEVGCFNPFNTLSINAKGDILFCGCNVTQDTIGNVLNDNMLEVWQNNSLLDEARKKMRAGVTPSLCENCSQKINGQFVVVCK